MEDQKVIREQMQDTRSALSEKLEILEDRVSTTVQDATHEVSETVEAVTDSVQETVESVKDTVADTITAVKTSVDAVKGFFDLPRHADRYPWIVLGGSVAFGFIVGELLFRNAGRPRSLNHTQPPHQDPVATAAHSNNGQGNGRTDNGNEPAKETLLDQLAPDLSALKGLALGALMGTVREMATKAAGENLGQPLSEIIDSVTKKMGGKPVASKPPEAPKPKEDVAPDGESTTAEASQPRGRKDESWQHLTGKR